MDGLPPVFIERLRQIIPQKYIASSLKTFSAKKNLAVRINTLKINKNALIAQLQEKNIRFKEISWCREALILEGATAQDPALAGFFQQGFLYAQSLSSLLPVLALDPKPGEAVLDFCAAPGSKTTQMAALMHNQGTITAVENIKGRFFKLKSVLSLMNAENVTCKLTDARRFRPWELFDKILVDAPCSSEGRFSVHDKKSCAFWSPRKIKEMSHKQKGILLAAGRLLKAGGILVYSTCTFAPEENEGVIGWFLGKTGNQFEVVPVDFPDIQRYPALGVWQGKKIDPQIQNSLRILPTKTMEGFFITKLARKW